MLFLTPMEFFVKALKIENLSREQEKELYLKMKAGDMEARKRIIQSYIKIIACKIKRQPKEMHSLDLIYRCLDKLEKAVDRFNFLQDGETFNHTICVIMQREIITYKCNKL